MGRMIGGRAHVFGDDVDTDAIIPARRCLARTMRELGRHCFEDRDPGFARRARRGVVVVAGRNFGCGSAREMAPLALRGAGVSCVVAASFNHAFYRNSINAGLTVMVCPAAAAGAAPGDTLVIDAARGVIVNRRTGRTFYAEAPHPSVRAILEAGGIAGYVRRRAGRGHAATRQ